MSQSAHVAPNATVYGDVFIAKDSYVGFGAVVDGLYSPIQIRANTKIGDKHILNWEISSQQDCVNFHFFFVPALGVLVKGRKSWPVFVHKVNALISTKPVVMVLNIGVKFIAPKKHILMPSVVQRITILIIQGK